MNLLIPSSSREEAVDLFSGERHVDHSGIFFTVATASLGLCQLSGPAVGGLLADWFGPTAIGWFAAATYGAGALAAAADGFFARTWIGGSSGGGPPRNDKCAWESLETRHGKRDG